MNQPSGSTRREMAAPGYAYVNAASGHHHAYLLPTVDRILEDMKVRSVFDLGCGNGSVASHLAALYDVTGADASESGIAQAKAAFPELRLEVASAYDDLALRFGVVDAVVSLEVIEHLYDPRLYARRMFDLVRPGGVIIVSTPYHGYWKNIALAISGKMDSHFTALWDGGHIKFWSIATLTTLLEEAGFVGITFHLVGRVPALAKSMIAVAHRPT